jgi:beta-aspartyl-peptidase (threonine type)
VEEDESRGSTEPAKPQAETAGSWALAIHGGAGSDPASWPAGKRAARQAGLRQALQRGKTLLQQGASAVETVEAVIRVFEDDAHFNAGRGAVLTTAGEAELDAAIMDGRTAACGAVGGVTTARNPISLARLVMTETPHVLLVGPGADQFAKQQAAAGQLELVTLDYFLSHRQQHHNQEVTPVSPAPPKQDDEPHFGTVGCVVRDAAGHLAAGTSTGGTRDQLPGRIGDSPIVGAGTYAADDCCAVSGTGVGEEYIRHAVAYDIAAQIRYAARPLAAAVEEIMLRRLQPGVGGVIAIDRDGTIVMQHNTPGMSCGAADSEGRFEIELFFAKSAKRNLMLDQQRRQIAEIDHAWFEDHPQRIVRRFDSLHFFMCLQQRLNRVQLDRVGRGDPQDDMLADTPLHFGDIRVHIQFSSIDDADLVTDVG